MSDLRLRLTLFVEAGRLALWSIRTHKLRTFLTLLGIIMGVASVVVVGASIQGLQTYVTDTVARTLGSDSFSLSRFAMMGNVSEEEWQRMLRRNRIIRLSDLDWIARRCPDCAELAAEVSTVQNVQASSEIVYDTSVQGVTANILYLGSRTVEEGRFFTEDEVQRSAMVCVIGWDLKERLFPHVDPIGREVRLGNHRLRVIGVAGRMGSSFGQSLDNVLYIPIRSFLKLYGSRRSITIRGRAVSRENFESALDQVRVAMRVRNRLRPGEDDNFGLVSTDQINDQVGEFTGSITMVVIPITLISLLVGGIVVMNIMLVTVTERTFEIGLSKALGARRRDVVFQFLIESFLVAVLGGILGVLLAWGVSEAVEATTPLKMTVTAGYVALALAVSGGIGVVFGIYPAVKASRLDPIVALTAER